MRSAIRMPHNAQKCTRGSLRWPREQRKPCTLARSSVSSAASGVTGWAELTTGNGCATGRGSAGASRSNERAGAGSGAGGSEGSVGRGGGALETTGGVGASVGAETAPGGGSRTAVVDAGPNAPVPPGEATGDSTAAPPGTAPLSRSASGCGEPPGSVPADRRSAAGGQSTVRSRRGCRRRAARPRRR
ncbi:hypothetical protein ACFQX8_03235 [Klenkia terrae]|uniref:hypothetical protein n=1 Tax=Klenkia terrae TaxID=1052259 RepID=UPI0036242176